MPEFQLQSLMVFIRKLTLSIALLISTISTLFAQEPVFMATAEDTLAIMNKAIYKGRDDSSRIALNSLFCIKLKESLQLPGAFSYPFDSLKGISRLRSDDNRFRIITWNIPLDNGTFKYFGFIDSKDGKLIELHESNSEPSVWENQLLDKDNWYGALYYKLISVQYKKSPVYTLLGWDGNNPASNLKIIDIISFDEKGNPHFGSPVFKTADGIRNRVLIEYAKSANAILRYDYQSLLISKGKRIKEKKSWMIVTDRLIPMTPSMQGIKRFYVPSGDTYDAYLYKDGFWTFVEDIRVGNTLP